MFKTVISTFLVFLVASLVIPQHPIKAQESVYLQKKQNIASQITKINSDLGSVNQSFHDVTAQKNTLQEQVKTQEDEIKKTDDLITESKVAISLLDDQIQQNEKDLSNLKDQMKSLVREIQKQDKISPIETVLSSQNLSDAITKVYNLSALQSKADTLSQKISDANKELENSKQQQEEAQKALENTKYLQNSKRDGLNLLLQETQGEEAKYQELLSSLKDQQKQLQSQSDTAERDYQAQLAARRAAESSSNTPSGNSNGGGSSGGTSGGASSGSGCYFEDSSSLTGISFINPTGGQSYISQGFCPGSGYDALHDGLDMANGVGTHIIAAASGLVVKKGFENGGFGYFIVIRHTTSSGRHVYSLYAHLNSSGVVNVGDGVQSGELIGYMGSTGNSTGPHLHFMLITDSYEQTGSLGCHYGSTKCYNPAKYIS